jgi:hypothetical protein
MFAVPIAPEKYPVPANVLPNKIVFRDISAGQFIKS